MRPTSPTPLLFGPYRPPPRIRRGSIVQDAIRGNVVMVRWSAAPLRWPIGRQPKEPSGLIVTDELVRALKSESGLAIYYWWGIMPSTVTRWKQSLGIKEPTAGSKVLKAPKLKPPKVYVRKPLSEETKRKISETLKRRRSALTEET